jgi:hypothetical protein
MPSYAVRAAFAALLGLAAVSAQAEKQVERPALFSKLVECKAIADSTQRLACYDAQVSAIDAAEKKQDLVVMDRAQIRETRRSLFGFTLPRFTLGGKKVDDADDVQEIETTIRTARRAGYDWVLTLEDDNGTWQTSEPLGKDPPKAGTKIRIKKALMGSYLATIGISRGVRLKRVG